MHTGVLNFAMWFMEFQSMT